ncbi:MAG: wax ester/triacylglycerol synthase family O-acyltransferase [Bacteroidota bacterium]
MPRTKQSLSAVDTAWLRMERPTNLMMITGVLTFDERVDFAALRATLSERLAGKHPRFRQRVIRKGVGPPAWRDVSDFNIDDHVRFEPEVLDRAGLEAFVSRRMSASLRFDRPLWDTDIVYLKNGGTALIVRVHHSVGDGIALIRVLISLTDDSANPNARPAETAPAKRRLKKDWAAKVRQGARSVAYVARRPRLWRKGIRTGAQLTSEAVGLLTMDPDTPTPMKGPLDVQKVAAWTDRLSLDAIKRIGRAHDATVNDVLMAVAAGALRRHFIDSGVPLAENAEFRVAIPVNLRPLDEALKMGNRFGLAFLALPIGIADPAARLAETRQRMNAVKASTEPVVAFGILNLIGVLPLWGQEVIVGLVARNTSGVLTNVPGPRQSIYLAGKRVHDIMFWVPQTGRVGLGISILSYDGNVLVGVTSDKGLMPNPSALVSRFEEEVRRLDA